MEASKAKKSEDRVRSIVAQGRGGGPIVVKEERGMEEGSKRWR